MKKKLSFISGILFILFTACDSPESLIEKGKKKLRETEYESSYDREDKVLPFFDKALKKDSTYAKAYLERAKAYLELNNSYKALPDLYKYVSLEHDNLEAWKLIAEHEGQKNLDKKLIAVNTVISKDPQSYEAYKIKIQIFRSLKEYDKALKTLETIVNRDLFEDERDVKMLYGKIYYGLEKWYDSYHAFRAGYYYKDNVYKPLHHIKQLAQNGDTKAKDFLISIDENDVSYSQMAIDSLEVKSYKKALRLFEKAGEFTTKGTEDFALNRAYRAKTKATMAGKGLYDDNSLTVVNKGKRRALEEALRLCERSLESGETLLGIETMGFIQMHRGFYKKSEEAFNKAAKLGADSEDFYYFWTLVLNKNSHGRIAIQLLDNLIKEKGNVVWIYLQRASILDNYGENYKAEQDYKHVLSISPHHYGALAGLAEMAIKGNDYHGIYAYLFEINKHHGASDWMRKALENIPKEYYTEYMRKLRSEMK